MKFSCPKCNTRYTIADDKVPVDKTVKFPCKKCDTVIRLKRKPPTPMPMPNTSSFHGATRVASPEEMDKLRQDTSLSKPMDDEATRVAEPGEIEKVRESSAKAPDVEHEWFVLIAGKQKGPLSEGELLNLFTRAEIDARSYVWRDGMANWLRLSEVDIYKKVEATKNAARPDTKGSGEATVAMDARELQEKLKQTVETAKRQRASSPQIQNNMPEHFHKAQTTVASPEHYAAVNRPTQDLEREFKKSAPTDENYVGAPVPTDSQKAKLDELIPAFADSSNDASGVPDSAYMSAPPGEATKLFMTTAGIYKRERNNRIAAVVAGFVVVALFGFAALDIVGAIQVPGMGKFYDVTGLVDPNKDRAVARVEEKLLAPELAPEDRARLEQLRQKLLGTNEVKARPIVTKSEPNNAVGVVKEGVQDIKTLNSDDKDLAASIFDSKDKKESKIELQTPQKIETPNLPEGLTQDAVYKVIADNTRSMSLCIAEAARKGEKLVGKMDIALTIDATGDVSNVDIDSPQFKNSTMASCTIRRIKGWKFPKFNGAPVTVVYPYILQMGM